MNREFEWYKLVDRAKNFRIDYVLFQEQVIENEDFYMNLYALKNNIIVDLIKAPELNRKQMLKHVVMEVFNFVSRKTYGLYCFYKNRIFHDNVFKACFFTTLCMFIHETKRISGVSIRRFLYDNSPYQYNKRNSRFYFDYDWPQKDSIGFDQIKNEEMTLRKMRHRLLSKRPVYNKHPEWSAFPNDSKYEWTFLYVLDTLDEDLLDIYKRIGNLYNDINTVIREFKIFSAHTKHYHSLDEAYKKFSSKLRKIDYTKFLNLQKNILLHISKNKSHYGINSYRFEKRLGLYIITSEIKRLLESKDAKEENDILEKFVILNNLQFPKLYCDFRSLNNLNYIESCMKTFFLYLDSVVISSLLIIDELVENNFLGEDWEELFLDTINEMTEKVFYEPNEIDYTVASESQEQFIKLLSAPVRSLLYRMANLSFAR